MSVKIYNAETDTLKTVAGVAKLDTWTGTQAEWDALDKSALSDNCYINITDDLTEAEVHAVVDFDAPIEKWLVDANNSAATAKLAEANGIAVGFIRQTGTNTTMVHEIDANGKDSPVTGSDMFAGGCYVNPVFFPVKKGCKYYISHPTGSIESYNPLRFYPFKSKVIEPLKPEDKYSTEETVIGEWIDGKPLYRRVIQVDGAISSKFPMTIPDIENVAKFDAYVEWNSNTRLMSHSCMTPSNLVVPPLDYQFTSDGLDIGTVSSSVANYYMSQLIIEYTKTTD